MKIISVEVVPVTVPAHSPKFHWRDGLPGSDPQVESGWLVIRTDAGINGYCFVTRGAIMKDVVERRIRADLVGRDVYAREEIWHRLWELDRIERFPTFVIGAVDVAVWDIAGKAANLPVYKLLGYSRTAIPAYASTTTFDSIEQYLDVADACLDLGYTAIKLHAWGDVARDSALIEALRSHVGDSVPLMYDGSAGFDLPDAIQVGRTLAANGYLWYEEPMKEFSVGAYRRLGESVDVPLLVCEVAEGAHMSAANFIASGGATYVRTGAQQRGGFTGAMRIAHLADSYLMRAEVHAPGLASQHLCMAIKNTTYYESLVDRVPAERAPEVDERGMVLAPERAGVGSEELIGSAILPESVFEQMSKIGYASALATV